MISVAVGALSGGLLTFGLVACGGSSHPAASSTLASPTSAASRSAASTATTTAPAPSPTATTPLLTGAAVKPGEVPPTQNPKFITDDSAGAISFAGYFYRALDWSIATTNANLLRPISAPTCRPCQQYISEIDALAATGGHSEGARLSAYQFAPVDGTLIKSNYVIKVTFDQDAEVFISADGSRHTPAPPSNPGVNLLYVDWLNGGWHAMEIQLGP